jgi:hypothetical protein
MQADMYKRKEEKTADSFQKCNATVRVEVRNIRSRWKAQAGRKEEHE